MRLLEQMRLERVELNVVSFNTVIKAYLQNGNFDKAWCLVEAGLPLAVVDTLMTCI